MGRTHSALFYVVGVPLYVTTLFSVLAPPFIAFLNYLRYPPKKKTIFFLQNPPHTYDSPDFIFVVNTCSLTAASPSFTFLREIHYDCNLGYNYTTKLDVIVRLAFIMDSFLAPIRHCAYCEDKHEDCN